MGKKVSFQITSLIKGSSTCGAFVWRFLFRFEASKGLILHKLPGLTYYCTFSYRNAQLEISGLATNESHRGRTAPACSPSPAPKGLFDSSRAVAFRAPGAQGKRPPRRSPAPGLPLPDGGRHGPSGRAGRSAPLRTAPLRAAGLPRRPAPAAAEAGLKPSTKNASKRRRGQNQTRDSLPAANRVPAGFKPVSRGCRFYAGRPRPRR